MVRAVSLTLAAVLTAGGILGAAPAQAAPLDPAQVAPPAAAAGRAAAHPAEDPVPVPPEPVPTEPLPTPAPTPTPGPTISPTPTPTPTQTPTPTALPAALGSWCTALFPPLSSSATKRRALQLLDGYVDLGRGGSYTLGSRPNWKPQSTADNSGNRHVNSLNWALPLLYQGVKAQNRTMIERFTQLLRWWIDDHRVPVQRDYWVNASIFGGLRTQTLVCAAQTLADPIIADAALSEAGMMLATFANRGADGVGADNTDLIRQTGAFAAYCWSGDVKRRLRAWANLVQVAEAVVQADGSDVEGSPAYAVYDDELLRDIESSTAVCGTDPAPIPDLRQSMYAFIVQAVRPDGLLESLGDGVAEPLPDKFGAGDPVVEWVRTGGASGTPPLATFATFGGGYALGRTDWTPPSSTNPGSFWSLRWTSDRPPTAHTHDDGGAVTFASRGVSWIGDPGPYRYDNSSFRRFVKTRPAHSSITVSGVARPWRDVVRLTSTSGASSASGPAGADDVACVRDRTWSTVTWTRCVRYVRSVDALVVSDTVTATRIVPTRPRPGARPSAVSPRVITQRWQLPPGVSAAPMGTGAALVATASDGSAVALDVVADGPGTWTVQSARSGQQSGWFTTDWGHKGRGSVLARSTSFAAAGGTARWTTVLLPRSGDESVTATLDSLGVTIARGATTVTVPR